MKLRIEKRGEVLAPGAVGLVFDIRHLVVGASSTSSICACCTCTCGVVAPAPLSQAEKA